MFFYEYSIDFAHKFNCRQVSIITKWKWPFSLINACNVLLFLLVDGFAFPNYSNTEWFPKFKFDICNFISAAPFAWCTCTPHLKWNFACINTLLWREREREIWSALPYVENQVLDIWILTTTFKMKSMEVYNCLDTKLVICKCIMQN